MQKNNLTKILLFISIFLFVAPVTYAYTFNSDLKVGSSGQDVYELQKFLNTYSPQTIISQSGIGSVGNETNYFGNLTKLAVQRFQELNYDQILKPSNLVAGSGYFGQNTRNFVNNYVNTSSGNSKLPTSKTTTFVTTPKQNSYTNFLLLSKYTVQNGEEISLAGQTTDPISSLDFYIENQKLKKNCPTKYVCSVQIDTNSLGKKFLTTSDSSISPEAITIRDKNSKIPSIDLESIKFNTDTTIKGENLTENIKIYTPFNIFVSQTRNNSFIINIQNPNNQLKEAVEGYFYVENSDGIVSDIMIINYEI